MSSDTKWIIGTVVAMTALVVSVLTFGVGRSLASIDERLDTVNARIDGMDDGIGDLEGDVREIEATVREIDGKFSVLNTTLLFLTTCLVDQEGPLPVVAVTAAGPPSGDPDRPSAPVMPPQVEIELPESCRTAHTRALQGAR